jgi:hypothetical protein
MKLPAVALVALLTALAGMSMGCGHSHGRSRAGGSPVATVERPSDAASGKRRSVFVGDEDDDDVRVPRVEDSSKDNDADFDNDLTGNRGKGYRDSDDGVLVRYGRAADAEEQRQITVLFQDYHAAGLAGNGENACRYIYSVFRRAIPEVYGSDGGSPSARSKTCGEVMTRILRHNHGQLDSSLRVTSVRIKGNKGFALLGSPVRPASYMNVQREHGSWKLVGLLPTPLP